MCYTVDKFFMPSSRISSTSILSSPLATNQPFMMKILIAVVAALLLAVIVLAWYVLDVARSSSAREATVNVPSQSVNKSLESEAVTGIAQGDNEEVKTLVDKVGRHIVFPQGRVMVSTVVDPNYLRQQNPMFFQYAKEGDKLLAYPNGFILYDPLADVIIDVWRLAPTTAN